MDARHGLPLCVRASARVLYPDMCCFLDIVDIVFTKSFLGCSAGLPLDFDGCDSRVLFLCLCVSVKFGLLRLNVSLQIRPHP